MQVFEELGRTLELFVCKTGLRSGKEGKGISMLWYSIENRCAIFAGLAEPLSAKVFLSNKGSQIDEAGMSLVSLSFICPEFTLISLRHLPWTVLVHSPLGPSITARRSDCCRRRPSDESPGHHANALPLPPRLNLCAYENSP